MDCYFGINGFHHINTTKRVQHNFMMHPLCCIYIIDMFLETTVYILEIFSISSRTTAVVRLHISCYALAQ